MITIKKLTELKNRDVLNLSRVCAEAEVSVKTIHSKITRQTELTPQESESLTKTIKRILAEIRKFT